MAGPDGVRLVVEVAGRQFDPRHLFSDWPRSADELVRSRVDWQVRLQDPLEAGDVPELRTGRWLAPFAAPPLVIAVGLNYYDHCRELGVVPPSDPSVFVKLPSSVCGPGDAIHWNPSITTQVDLEVELGVVMGRDASGVSPGAAEQFIYGYTVINDLTARDIQRREQQWVRAKSIDSFCPIGPVVVSRDEVPDPQSLELQSRINGVSMQRSSTREMIFPVAELVSRLSHSFTLRAGDVIATGTPWGVGAFRTPPTFLKDGDVVEVEVEGIGVLRNTCVVD